MAQRDGSYETSESQITKEELEQLNRMEYGDCEHCGGAKTDHRWCMICNAKHFREVQRKSGNNLVDEFIRNIQDNAVNRHKVLELVPFENFNNVEFIAKGGYGKVYKAKWKDGFIHYFDNKNQKWKRQGEMEVVLKGLHNSKNITEEFLDEIKLQMRSHYELGNTIECFGITKDPETGDFMMIMEFMKDGSLRNYLSKNFLSLTWTQKLEILCTAAKGLRDIHEAKLIHKDLHPGNIVLSQLKSSITDFGFCKPADYKPPEGAENGKIFGVLPYIAPEILCEKKYTMATDIYSFGMIIYEVSSGCPPFFDVEHDSNLALEIARGRRPEINKNLTPQLVIDLIERCWKKDPNERPSANELHDCLWGWYSHSKSKSFHKIKGQIEEIEKSQSFEKYLNNLPCNNNSTLLDSHESNTKSNMKSYTSSLIDISRIVKSVGVSDTGIVDLVIPEVIDNA